MEEVRGGRYGVGCSLTPCSQGQASSAASNEVIQGVIGLFSDLGTDAGGDAKYGTNGSCGGRQGGMGSESEAQRGVMARSVPGVTLTEEKQDTPQAYLPAVKVYRPVLATPSRKESGGLSATL